MITDAGNEYADHLLKTAKEIEASASSFAVMYAQSDNNDYKMEFKKLAEKANFIRKMYSEFCGTMHAIEAEMTKRLSQEKSK